MEIRAIQTTRFAEGDDLVGFVLRHTKIVPEKSVLVVASKVVALAEHRTSVLLDLEGKEALIRAESEYAIRTKHVWLTVKDGLLCASSGIDESNADGRLILLPRDSFKAAYDLRSALCRVYRIDDLGVIVTDSRTIPLRAGVVGMAIGYAGFRGLRDYVGTPDLFGRTMEFSRTDVADSLATAATLVMGEGNESCPLTVITDAPVEFCDTVDPMELRIDPTDDMFAPLFENMPGIGE